MTSLSLFAGTTVVKNIKSHLNPKLCLPMYSSYKQPSKAEQKTNNDINKPGLHKKAIL